MPQSENELSPRIRTIAFMSKFGENDKAQGEESMPIGDGLTLGPRRSRTRPLFRISPPSELGCDTDNEDMHQSENEPSPRLRTIDFLSKFGENDKAQAASTSNCDWLTLGTSQSRTEPLFRRSPPSESGLSLRIRPLSTERREPVNEKEKDLLELSLSRYSPDQNQTDHPKFQGLFGPRTKSQTDLHATMLALTKLPANAEEEELLRLTLGQTDSMQGLTGLPQPVNNQLEDVVGHPFGFGTHHPQPEPTQPQPWPIHFYYYPYPPLPSMQADYFTSYLLTQNPTLVQPLMPPHQAGTENPPQLPVKRDLPAPQRGDQSRRRSEKSSAPKNGKSETIPPPFPWATDRCATVYDLKTLAEMGIETVSGEIYCSHCEKKFSVSYNILDEFSRLRAFVEAGKASFNHRAPPQWTKPVLPDCRLCGRKNCTKPVIAEKKKNINWLFLLLGSLLGLCSLEQLKYFCKHTLNHRTGAKDRVMYLAYLGLCKQLDETGPFEALD